MVNKAEIARLKPIPHVYELTRVEKVARWADHVSLALSHKRRLFGILPLRLYRSNRVLSAPFAIPTYRKSFLDADEFGISLCPAIIAEADQVGDSADLT